jgi:hypothetical protein
MQKSPSNSKPKLTVPVVEIKAVTWNKDSHGLFDYENSQYEMKKFQLDKSALLYRNRNEIFSQEKSALNEEIEGDVDHLISISRDCSSSDKFHIDIPGDFSQTNRTSKQNYLIIRSLKCKDGRSQRGYVLQPGDIMKLGRIEYRVIEISTRSQVFSESKRTEELMDMMPNMIFDGDAELENYSAKDNVEEKICKYCLMENVSDIPLNNLMLYLCKCKEGVHYQCLKNWMQYKIISKVSTNIASYQWKKLDCEICLIPWPRKIKYQSELHEMITIEKPEVPYIIIEKLVNEPNSSSTMSIIVPDSNNQIKMGRGHQCELRVSDISVSRVHAYLKYENDNFLIFDNDSKFGTLILLKKDYPVKQDKAAIQIGRTVFTFVMKGISREASRSSQQFVENTN